ncbi:B12-binding domain-containing radical SAM protein [Acidobacteriota bacterium]
MKVSCIYTMESYVTPQKPMKNFQDIHLGMAFIATALKNGGFDVDLMVITPHTDYRKMLELYIRENKPRLFCFTAVTTQYLMVCRIARAVHEIDPSIFILLGGCHASLNPEDTIREGCFDAICIGEGEEAVVRLANHIEKNGSDPRGINALWFRDRKSGDVEKNETNRFQQDLDALPYMDIGLWENWVADKSQLFTIPVGRGCAYKCAYCSNHALAKLAKGRYVRFRSPQNIIGEIERIIADYPFVKAFLLRAETLSIDLDYTFSLVEALEALNRRLKKPLQFVACLSPRKNLIQDDRLLKKMKAANIVQINLALESGSERIRREILRRPRYSNDEIIRLCTMARDLGIKVGLCSMIGLPGETRDDFRETVSVVRSCFPTHAYLFIFYPYPGTDLHDMAEEMGLLKDSIVNPTSERKIARYGMPGFSRWQIQREFLLFYYRVYRGKIPLSKIMARMIRELIFIHPRINALFKKLITYRFMKPIVKKLSTDPQHEYVL